MGEQVAARFKKKNSSVGTPFYKQGASSEGGLSPAQVVSVSENLGDSSVGKWRFALKLQRVKTHLHLKK